MSAVLDRPTEPPPEVPRSRSRLRIPITLPRLRIPIALPRVRLPITVPPVRLRVPTTVPSVRLPAVPRDRTIMVALAMVALVVHGRNMTGYPAVGDDEGTYLAQAWALQHGLGLAPYTYWYDHPPLGWVQIAALSWIPALLMAPSLAVADARVLTLLVSVVSTCLLHVLGRRMALPRWAAALGALLFALSPLAVTLQRQLYLDNIAVVWMLGAFVLALSPRRHLWHHVAAGCCAAVAVLSKETMLVVLPAVLVGLWQGSHPTTRKFSIFGFLTLFGLVGVLYPLYATLNNELLPGPDHVSLIGGILFQLQRAGSGSFLNPTSASRAIVDSWLYYDTILPVAGIGAALVAVAVLPRLRAPALAVLVLLAMAMRPGYLPAMFVIQALPFMALCIAGVLSVGVAAVLPHGPLQAGVWRWERTCVVAVTTALLAVLVVPPWVEGDRVAMTQDANVEYRQAVAALVAIPHTSRTRVMVDDAMWLDLVDAGYQPGQGAIWFYKLDLDPAVELPHGWHDLDYVVSTPIIRQAMSGLTTVTEAVNDSTVVQTFGSGDERIEIRRVEKSP